MRKKFVFWSHIAMLLTPLFGASAVDLQSQPGFTAALAPENVGGGLTYLADGDVIAFTSDYAVGPALVRLDTNADGIPAGGKLLIKQFDSSVYPAFVQVSPGGTFVLAGVSGGDNTIYRIDVPTSAIAPALEAPGNYDFIFIDDTRGYLSSNPGGFDSSQPNEIALVELAAPAVSRVIAKIDGTPSGPVALNSFGDLYYIKGMWTPPFTGTLLKLRAGDLLQAAATGTVLTEADAAGSIPVAGGYDIVFNRLPGGNGQLFFSTIGDTIYRLLESTLTPEVFFTASDPTFPAITGLSLHKPDGAFDAAGVGTATLGASVATDFFATFSLVQIKPAQFDTDEDGTADSSDLCAKDPAKIVPGPCGCGAADTDTNRDRIVDCGTIRSFSPSVRPRIGSVQVSGRDVAIVLEKLKSSGLKYIVELTGPSRGRTKTIRPTSNGFRLKKLARGTYTAKFRVERKSGGKTLRSRTSGSVKFTVR